MIPAAEALQLLRDGNRRFVANVRSHDSATEARRAEVAAGQEPFAIILGCSDSRVPAEIVFDQGLGRSLRHPRRRQHRRAVTGRQRRVCGGALRHAARGRARTFAVRGHPGDDRRAEAADRTTSPGICIRSSIACALRWNRFCRPRCACSRIELVRHAVRANVRSSVSHLRHGSEMLEQLIEKDNLVVVGAEYSLETGVVDFFDG